jgi:single-strand DNA-binding protein
MNKVILIGNIGGEIKTKTFDSGNQVAEFSLATSEKYKDKNGQVQKETTWHNVVVWGKLAQVVTTYCAKGSKLMIEGKIKNEQYEKDGQTKYVTKIVCNNFEMLGSNSQQSQQTAPQQQNQQQSTQTTEVGEGLPF